VSDTACTSCGGRVDTIVAGRPLCAPCATAELLPLAELAEQLAEREPITPPADDPDPARLARLRTQVRAEAKGRPWPLPRGVLDAEARTPHPPWVHHTPRPSTSKLHRS
jgi:hypothetical protein